MKLPTVGAILNILRGHKIWSYATENESNK